MSLPITVAKDQDIQDVASDLSEVFIDLVTTDELVKAIPVIGTLVHLARAKQSITDKLFARKVRSMILGAGPADAKRLAFFQSLDADHEVQQRVGQVIVMALDRADDFKKAAIIGRLTSLYAAAEFTFDEFRRLLCAIDRAFIDDLLAFPGWALQGEHPPNFDPSSLVNSGLVSPSYQFRAGGNDNQPNVQPLYGRSRLGVTYCKHLLGFRPLA